MADCIFCDIINEEVSSLDIYEDENVLAFLDINPLAKGHTLVIPKKHAEKLEELNKEGDSIFSVVHKLAPKIAEAVQAPAYNLFVNNGEEAGQEIPHVHYHILPRFEDDGGRAGHAIMPSPPSLDEKELEEIQNKIRQKVVQ